MSTILYGNEFAQQIRKELESVINERVNKGYRRPQLAILCVGNDVGSHSYILSTQKSCAKVGIEVVIHSFDEEITQEELKEKMIQLNQDDTVDAIMMQMPLPRQLSAQQIVDVMDPNKDVDGLHSLNVAKLYTKQDGMIPCTPEAIVRMLKHQKIELTGKEVVVVGRSQSVGRPVAQLLLNENATVTICHSKTKNLAEVTSRADIVVIAIGKAKTITKEYIKEGAVVIDVGVNVDEHGKLCGDVDFDDVEAKTSCITPVPKGLGPVTTAMLMENVVKSYKGRV
ncbi:MAG: bifunctional 5,10-methylenetetrahydrofolate dehydrogenase/5,10-methenyltetrahydrofolate cyclohydrolase [Erysipelotrichaceae bacterium]|nr:bifunctional 5,10-methylenetetrahydrofolate dehydrogenase/5,10-methenyltetrahydrofolate cyclohydrolase [Erysipelotrichaceae bacterium]